MDILICGNLQSKPGKPFASGKIMGKQFFGLPGNPVSAFVTFLLLVKPCLLSMLGSKKVRVCERIRGKDKFFLMLFE